MRSVAVVGASGFVGSSVATALEGRGARVIPVQAPRISTSTRDRRSMQAVMEQAGARFIEELEALAEATSRADVVINAAGTPASSGGATDALFGANALLPGLIKLAVSARPIPPRFIHVSSAAVQGRAARLDESELMAPFSPYSASKALGEIVLADAENVVIFRPTSVHGVGRPVTDLMRRVCASPLASVAGPGRGATPQVLVENVGDAIAFVALTSEEPPRIILQPGEGLTVSGLVRVLGGREPLHVPMSLATSVRAGAFAAARIWPSAAGTARRIEMMWFGQEQASGWLSTRWQAPVGLEGWSQLAQAPSAPT